VLLVGKSSHLRRTAQASSLPGFPEEIVAVTALNLH
jgi:hypothetical protein